MSLSRDIFHSGLRGWSHLLVNWLYLSDLCIIGLYCLSSFSWGIAILIVQECQTNSQFHSCNSQLQIWQRAFSHFLIPNEKQHLVDPKQNFHTPGPDAPVLCKLSPLHLGDKEINIAWGNQGFLLAYLQILLTCIFHLKSSVFSILSTFWRMLPTRQLHHIAFDGLESHTDSISLSRSHCLQFHCVLLFHNFTIADTIIGKKPYFGLKSVEIPLIYNENSKVPKTVPCGTTWRNWSPIWLHFVYNNSLLPEAQETVYPFQHCSTYFITEQFTFKEFMRGISKAFSKSKMNVSTCPFYCQNILPNHL